MAKSKKTDDTEAKPSKKLQEFQGFKVLPVIMTEDKNVRHYFYMRKHESKSLVDEDIKDRTLFLLNLPTDTTDRHLRKLFKGHGIEQITYSDSGASVTEEYWKIMEKKNEAAAAAAEAEAATKKNKRNKKRKIEEEEEQEEEETVQKRELRRLFTSGSSAHIVFSTNQDLLDVLNMTRVEKKWAKEDEQTEQPLGFGRYLLAYQLSRPNAHDLQKQVDSFMMKFKADEYKKEREKLERMNQMDEDGFTVVVRHKKAKTTDGSTNIAAISAEAAEQYQPKKKKELLNFYRFQMREQKQNELVELRKRFEEDKAKIAQLKQNRKFKPY
ncbi:ribosomal RNA-processing protein 7-domain-containing protein [Gilbertella persicaria]|uniref:Ribosomal RNA-processing protein 7 n=1 Tax=Rhizopus stolonifer TaxID=4846 RepID=A0A367KCD3_RHIST|nr:ribosomal RNA-processing protein 7-domain-containing protein [Gilbertella persicaria]KAI8084333.1 ribosomal RNA-processing protein 7-domain-containing protein [Gilbertella persicaria]RCH99836.1 Ribosomal RNA-processing protein 7 [Rhizopus stolonifer]